MRAEKPIEVKGDGKMLMKEQSNLEKNIIVTLEERGIFSSRVKVIGLTIENGLNVAETITVSLDEIDSTNNLIPKLKDVLDESGVIFENILLEV